MAAGDSGDMGMKHNPDPSDLIAGNLEEVAIEYVAEYDNLSSTIDQLDSCLDALEQKNDDLYTKVQDLLESSRQTRQELEAGRESPPPEPGQAAVAEDADENEEWDIVENSKTSEDVDNSDAPSSTKEESDNFKPR